jgi:peptidoglycan/xylan/chitin deacetylase (PgdA/CDA1 family)
MKPASMQVCLSVDVEPDCPPYLDTFLGIEQGLPALLALLAEQGVTGTFFVTGQIARLYPRAVAAIVSAGHELGCHGDTHQNFQHLSPVDARRELETASRALRNFGSLHAFRAPYLDFPEAYLGFLPEHGMDLDSSLGRYKPAHWRRLAGPLDVAGVRRVPVSLTSSMLRLPGGLTHFLLGVCSRPVVLFVHPWEFVDWRRTTLRPDCRFNTGEAALACLRKVIDTLQDLQAAFLPITAL